MSYLDIVQVRLKGLIKQIGQTNKANKTNKLPHKKQKTSQVNEAKKNSQTLLDEQSLKLYSYIFEAAQGFTKQQDIEESIHKSTSFFFNDLKANNPELYGKVQDLYLDKFITQEITDNEWERRNNDLLNAGGVAITDNESNRDILLRDIKKGQNKQLKEWIKALEDETNPEKTDDLKLRHTIFNTILGLETRSLEANVKDEEITKTLNLMKTREYDTNNLQLDLDVCLVMLDLNIDSDFSSEASKDDLFQTLQEKRQSLNKYSDNEDGISRNDFFDSNSNVILNNVYSYLLADPLNKKLKFVKRRDSSLKPYPEINREALVKAIADMKTTTQNSSSLNFPRLYAHYINESLVSSKSFDLSETSGEWRVFKKGSKPEKLVEALDGYNTGWCTAGYDFAESALKDGDFYIYCSYNNNPEPKALVPRIAIKMTGNRIAEIRGIAVSQAMDSYIAETNILETMLNSKRANGDPIFPDKEIFLRKDKDLKSLNRIYGKYKSGSELSKEDLTFIYEIRRPFSHFSQDEYNEQLNEMINSRLFSYESDMAVIFDIREDQFASSESEINENTLVYYPEDRSIIPMNYYENYPHNKIRKQMLDYAHKKNNLVYNLRDNNERSYMNNLGSKLDLDKMKTMHQNGADLGYKDIYNVSLLSTVLFFSNGTDKERSDIIEYLLDIGIEVGRSTYHDVICDTSDYTLFSQIMNAQIKERSSDPPASFLYYREGSISSNLKFAECLIDSLDIAALDKKISNSLFELLLKYKLDDKIPDLIEKGLDLSIIEGGYENALSKFTSRGTNPKLIKDVFLKNGFDLDERVCVNGPNPVYSAVKAGNIPMIKELHRLGADFSCEYLFGTDYPKKLIHIANSIDDKSKREKVIKLLTHINRTNLNPQDYEIKLPENLNDKSVRNIFSVLFNQI